MEPPKPTDQKFVGKETEEVRKLLGEGEVLRVRERDGEQLSGTYDFNPNRVNVKEKNGKITEILGRG